MIPKFLFSLLINVIFYSISFSQTYYLPGTGQLIKELSYEDSSLLNQQFDYGSGWAGSGFGLSGTQRGAPENISVISNPHSVDSSGNYVLSFHSQTRNSAWYAENPTAVGTNVYGGLDGENQDDFFMYGESWVAADTPSVMMHVYLPASATYTSLRMTVKYNNSNTNSWPGIWNYGNVFHIRGPGRNDIIIPTNAPNGGKDTWWTLGLSIAPDGDIQYYATPSFVTDLTSDHCIGFNSDLSQQDGKPYFPVDENRDAIIMSSNNNLSSTPTLFDNLYYTKGAQVDDFITSISSNPNTLGLVSVYPNPTSDYLFIEGLTNTTEYKIFDISGIEVKSGSVRSNKIEVNPLPKGTYFLMLDGYESVSFIHH